MEIGTYLTDKKIFIGSFILCFLFLIVFSFLEMEFDLISHFFGGIAVTVVLYYLVIKFTRFNVGLTLMLLCVLVCLFEIGESYILLIWKVYPHYNFEYILSMEYILDIISDIIIGIAGGYVYTRRCK